MRVLIVGGNSKLGEELYRVLVDTGDIVSRTTRRRHRPDGDHHASGWLFLDLLEPTLPRVPVDVVYLVAAVTRVVDCESDPTSWRVNADAPVVLALQTRDYGVHPHIIFVSSDAVERAPHMAYSRQKAHAEGVVLSIGGGVVRPGRISDAGRPALAELLADLGRQRFTGLRRWEEPVG